MNFMTINVKSIIIIIVSISIISSISYYYDWQLISLLFCSLSLEFYIFHSSFRILDVHKTTPWSIFFPLGLKIYYRAA